MFIHEAVKEAIEKKSNIARKRWEGSGWGLMLMEPIGCYDNAKKPVCWNPTPEDLVADDWEVLEPYNILDAYKTDNGA